MNASERVSLGYIYSASKTYSEIVKFTNNSVNVVSPTCFDMTVNGRLEINAMPSQSFIEEMHQKNIKVTPFLSNHWGRVRAQRALDDPFPLINELVEAIEEYNLDGVNIDMENLEETDANRLVEFTRLLREALPSDKILSIAVASNPEKFTLGWVAAYDYKELEKYVDYMVIMTYDEHCYGGSEGPVAGINFVRKSIEAVLEEVSRDKIVMGVPLYGRFWKEGEDVGGEAVVIANVPRLIKKYKLVPQYIIEEETPFVKLTVNNAVEGPLINGRILEEGTYNIWYENESSIRAKIAIANEYGLRGVGLWALDNEDEDFWRYYNEALNSVVYESEKEVSIRNRMEYAKKYAVEETEKTIEVRLEQKETKNMIDVMKRIRELLAERKDFKIKTVPHLLTNNEKSKYIKIKKFYIDENNKLRSSGEDLFFDTAFVRAVSTKALVKV